MAKLLNRAYERLNKVLDLAGSQAVNDIDIESAFAVHPLTGVIQDSKVLPFEFANTLTTLAGVTDTKNISPLISNPNIDQVYVDSILQSEWPNRNYNLDDWNIIVDQIQISVESNPANFVQCQFYVQDPDANYYPLTEILDTLSMNGTGIQAAAGTAYYIQDPPYFLSENDVLQYQVEAGAGGNLVTRMRVRGWLAKRGSYERL